MSTRRKEFQDGVGAELPVALGVLPTGMIYGVLAVAAGINPVLAQAMSLIVFAGSAQFIGVQLIGLGSPAAILLLTTLVINMRHLLYSASLAGYLKHLSPLWRGFLAYLLTDEAYVITALHYEAGGNAQGNKHWYFLGAGITLWACWQGSTAVGVLLGARVPSSWSLDFTLTLTFIGLLVPALANRPVVTAAIVAGIVAVLAAGLPFKSGLVLAAACGIFTGVAVERRTRQTTVNAKDDSKGNT